MKTLGDYLVMIIGISGSIASIIALYAFFEGLSSEGWIAVLFLGIICVYFIVYNFWLLSIYRTKSRYADAFAIINIGFSGLHKLRRKEDVTIDDILRELGIVCDNVSEVFGRIYNTNIGVSIKYIVSGNGNRPKVETLVRDHKSMTADRPTGTSDTIEHWIDSNTDFNFIYNNIENPNKEVSFFLERHLPNCIDYKNTRLGDTWKPKKYWYPIERIYRKRHWTLKYKSTLVVPIVPLLADEQTKASIRGFLCVDSPHEGQFNKTFDVAIMKGVSDGLYNQIDKIYSLNLQKK